MSDPLVRRQCRAVGRGGPITIRLSAGSRRGNRPDFLSAKQCVAGTGGFGGNGVIRPNQGRREASLVQAGGSQLPVHPHSSGPPDGLPTGDAAHCGHPGQCPGPVHDPVPGRDRTVFDQPSVGRLYRDLHRILELAGGGCGRNHPDPDQDPA